MIPHQDAGTDAVGSSKSVHTVREFLLPALRASLITWVLCGLAYPIAVTGIGQTLLPFQANGSLERQPDGTVIGSRLIGQQWDGPQWFHGRPSAIVNADPNDPTRTVPASYDAANSGGSNLAPASEALAKRLATDRMALELAQPELVGTALPADLLTTSASGLDPDISPANAALQVSRVARARNLGMEQIGALVRQHIEAPSFGVFGQSRVNVLRLNMALLLADPGR
jgi:K+-transporting ATPase ATPase C chain